MPIGKCVPGHLSELGAPELVIQRKHGVPSANN